MDFGGMDIDVLLDPKRKRTVMEEVHVLTHAYRNSDLLEDYDKCLDKLSQRHDEKHFIEQSSKGIIKKKFAFLRNDSQRLKQRAFLFWLVGVRVTNPKPHHTQLQGLYDTITDEVNTRIKNSVGAMRGELDQLIQNVSHNMVHAQVREIWIKFMDYHFW
jgi:hypothetical protein